LLSGRLRPTTGLSGRLWGIHVEVPLSPPRNVRISTFAPRKGRSSPRPTISRCFSRAQRIRPGGCGCDPQYAGHHHCDRGNDGEKGRRHEPGVGTRASPVGPETSRVKNPGHITGPPDPRARVQGNAPGRRGFRADLSCLSGPGGHTREEHCRTGLGRALPPFTAFPSAPTGRCHAEYVGARPG